MDARLNQLNQALRDELYNRKPKKGKRLIRFSVITALAAGLAFTAFSKIADSDPAQNLPVKIATRPINKFRAVVAGFLPSFLLTRETNFLLLGMPGYGNDAPDLTDTILLAKIDPAPFRVTFISIPRDLWVKIPDSRSFGKINSLYALGKTAQNQEYGLKLIAQKAEQITGEKIDYYALADLSVIKQIIDELGGINILVERDIKDEQFPGPNHSYQTFEIKAGWRYLDGETASKYMRTRHSAGGDFDRIGRQQQVLEAIKQKLMNYDPIFELPALLKIAADIWGSIQTNITLTQLPGLWQIAKKISPDQVRNIILDSDLRNGVLTSGRGLPDFDGMSVLIPKAGIENYEEIQKFIAETIN